MEDIYQILKKRNPVLLDGATATELQKRSIQVKAPLWTNIALFNDEGLNTLKEIHSAYINAGARIITANTFRTNMRSFKKLGIFDDNEIKVITGKAIDAVRQAKDAHKAKSIIIAGSVAPIEDCYNPKLVPSDSELIKEHTDNIKNLISSGVDVVLAETMNSIKEAETVLKICSSTKTPVLVSFVCNQQGDLLSNERIEYALEKAVFHKAAAFMINCSDFSATENALRKIKRLNVKIPIGIYPNVENRDNIPLNSHVNRYVEVKYTPTRFSDFISKMIDEFGIKIIGGCCGTSPEHINQLNWILNQRLQQSEL